MEARSSSGVLLDPANLYRVLRRMRALGWIEEADDASERRRTHRITGEGRTILAAESRPPGAAPGPDPPCGGRGRMRAPVPLAVRLYRAVATLLPPDMRRDRDEMVRTYAALRDEAGTAGARARLATRSFAALLVVLVIEWLEFLGARRAGRLDPLETLRVE